MYGFFDIIILLAVSKFIVCLKITRRLDNTPTVAPLVGQYRQLTLLTLQRHSKCKCTGALQWSYASGNPEQLIYVAQQAYLPARRFGAMDRRDAPDAALLPHA